WIWIDSCCIDNSDFLEPAEAINSVYRWYECIVCLGDLDKFGPCRWFQRGWTLQELIAPSRVLFYRNSPAGRKLYDPHWKSSFLRQHVPVEIKRHLHRIPGCQKMTWAANRKTPKVEDRVYSLIGIF
ncbi:uncharacterized protein A1O5_00691, partial [Cladophialophora psammophila CBS 110553]